MFTVGSTVRFKKHAATAANWVGIEGIVTNARPDSQLVDVIVHNPPGPKAKAIPVYYISISRLELVRESWD